MANVELRNISKIYDGKVHVVSNVSLNINDKEFVVLVGPSGCGKTTTLRMIAGLEEITSGELYIDNTKMNNVSPKDRDIAMVFQNYALYPHMTVYENMAFGLKLRKYPKEEINRRVNEAAKILGLENYLNRKPKALSGGQRQRVAVGRAIVRKPKVFLFDEPLSNLDAKLRVQMRTEISKLHQDLEATIIYVTHDQTEAMTMGDRIVVMKDGIVQQVDTPLNLYNNPLNKFVAGFIGSPSMNFLEGNIILHNNDVCFESKEKTFSFILDEILSEKAQNYIGKSLWLGIRPENISDIESADQHFNTNLEVKLEIVEPMGNEIFIYFSIDSTQFVARIPARTKPLPNTKMNLFFDLSKVHFFDLDSELRILSAI